MSNSTKTVRLTVIAADGLVKKDLFFKLPDPFGKKNLQLVPYIHRRALLILLHIYLAVVNIDGAQTHTTTVMKKTLNPYWNESFDL
jgi:E3 ubiquitin-protein ligase NEDD4